MAKVTVRTVSQSPTGAVILQARKKGCRDTHFYWNGVGSRLYLVTGNPNLAQVLHIIEHPSADGSYETRREAMEAVKRFMEA